MTAPFDIRALDDRHDRSAFASGNDALDRYLATQAGQDQRRRVSVCFAATPTNSQRVVGYHTLAAASVSLADLPEKLAKKLPRYPLVPAARIGRLAVDVSMRGQGLGGALLADALLRAARSEIAVHAAIVDAKDDQAAAFYRHHGFIAYGSQPRSFILPLATAIRAMEKAIE